MWVTKNILLSVLRHAHCRLNLLSFRNMSIRIDGPEGVWEGMYHRGVPRTMEEMSDMLRGAVDSPPDSRLLKVAVVGVPNCGKSTLINKLMGWRVCSVSSKVHTTKINARAVLNIDSTQVVFLDTPGLVTPTDISKHKLERTVLTEAEMSLQNADLVAVVHDMSDRYTYNVLNQRVLRLLALYPTIPSILVLNKLDLLKSKRHLLETTRILTDGIVGGKKASAVIKKPEKLDREKLIQRALNEDIQKSVDSSVEEICLGDPVDSRRYTEEDVFEGLVRLTEQEVLGFVKDRQGWPKFQDVFMVSGLKDLGVDDLRGYLTSRAHRAPWIFSSQVVTDQNPEEIVLMAVREKFLDTFKHEIAYEVQFKIEHWDLTEADLLNIVVWAGCKRQGLARFIVGFQGSRISDIASAAEQELRNTFRTDVRLRINVVYDASLKKKKFVNI